MRLIFLWLLVGSVPVSGEFLFYESDPINYSDTKSSDPIAAMAADYESGKLTFKGDAEIEFLRSVLDHLEIPIESQVLVYSKTSLQTDRISPKQPRAIYFNDDLYLGWVHGGDIELIAHDPDIGPVFYRMETPFGRGGGGRRLFRDGRCLDCHGSSRTDGYPGMLVRSVKADAIGAVIFGAGTRRTNHSSPIPERWGGWYVTGSNAGERHLGNLIFSEDKPGEALLEKDHGAKPKELSAVFDTKGYLSSRSDLVALMVMEHQIMAHNQLTKAHLDTRRWLHLDREIGKQTGRAEGEYSDSTKRLIERGANDLLKVMLFTEEAELVGWGVEGGEPFQDAFAASAKADAEGRSLRDLQLLSRMFKYRLSHTIYSQAFSGLHPVMKAEFYQQLHAALAGKSEAAAHLGEKERQRIIAIVRETKGDLPAYWRG